MPTQLQILESMLANGRSLARHFAFDESKHPRGQPDNPGQFAPSIGTESVLGKTASKKEEVWREVDPEDKEYADTLIHRASIRDPNKTTRDEKDAATKSVVGELSGRSLHLLKKNVSSIRYDDVPGGHFEANGALSSATQGALTLGSPTMMSLKEIFAHEVFHGIDGPDFDLSNSEEWKDAFDSEFKGKSSEAFISRAASERHEAFAEFGKILHAPKNAAGLYMARRVYPKSYRAFENMGILPKGAPESI